MGGTTVVSEEEEEEEGNEDGNDGVSPQSMNNCLVQACRKEGEVSMVHPWSKMVTKFS